MGGGESLRKRLGGFATEGTERGPGVGAIEALGSLCLGGKTHGGIQANSGSRRRLDFVRVGDRRFAGEEAREVLDRATRLTLHALMRARADMRRDDDVRQAEQRVIGGRRLLV